MLSVGNSSHKKIEGELAGRVVFKWEVYRVRRKMIIVTLAVSRGATFNPSALVFHGKSPSAVGGANVDRLNATIFGAVNQDLKVTYQLTLNDLQFSDRNSAFFESSSDDSIKKSGEQ